MCQMRRRMNQQLLINLLAGFAFLLPCVIWDIRTQLIPGWYLLIGLAVGIAGRLIMGIQGNIGMQDTLLSLLPGSFLVVMTYFTGEKIGLGDGVCFLILGLIEGGKICFMVFLFSFLLSSVFGIALVVCRRGNVKRRIPFLPFVTGGLGIAALFLLI